MTFRKVLSHCKTLKRYGSPIVHVLAGSFSSSLEKNLVLGCPEMRWAYKPLFNFSGIIQSYFDYLFISNSIGSWWGETSGT